MVRHMSRVHSSSKRPNIQSERMDSCEHEDRSSFGRCSQLPSRPLRNGDRDQLLVLRWNSFLGVDCEWNKQILMGKVGRNPGEPPPMTLETVQGNLLRKQERNKHQCRCLSPMVTLPYHPRRRTREVRRKLFRSVKKDDQIASTRSFSISRRRRAVEFRILAQMFHSKFTSSLREKVNSCMAELLAKRRRSQEEISVLCGSISC